MPATTGDIAAASRDVAVASWTSATIAGRYPSARDGSTEPAVGYFDTQADAQTMVDARATLIGTERRRFAVAVGDVLWPSISTAVPTMALTDAEQSASALNCLVARIEIDLEAETTNIELFG
jgi:hypothetical protein